MLKPKVPSRKTNQSRALLRLIRMLNLFPTVGTKVVKHYTTVELHRSFPHGVVFLDDP